MRILLGKDSNRISATQFTNGFAHGGEQVATLLPVQVNQMCNDFGVSIGIEAIASSGKPCAYLFVILDDAVVNDREAIFTDMRMRVTF